MTYGELTRSTEEEHQQFMRALRTWAYVTSAQIVQAIAVAASEGGRGEAATPERAAESLPPGDSHESESQT